MDIFGKTIRARVASAKRYQAHAILEADRPAGINPRARDSLFTVVECPDASLIGRRLNLYARWHLSQRMKPGFEDGTVLEAEDGRRVRVVRGYLESV